MRSVNKVILIGNLTRDPVVKVTAQGQKVVTFTVATNREWTLNSEKKSLTEFNNIAVWGKLCNVCENFLKKGKLVYIEGYLKTRIWENAEGVKMSRTEVVAYDMIMLNKKGELEGEIPEVTEEERDALEGGIINDIGGLSDEDDDI